MAVDLCHNSMLICLQFQSFEFYVAKQSYKDAFSCCQFYCSKLNLVSLFSSMTDVGLRIFGLNNSFVSTSIAIIWALVESCADNDVGACT